MDRHIAHLIAEGRERPYSSGTEYAGETGLVAVSGVLDAWTAPQFSRDIGEAVAAVRGDLVLDLSDLDLIDSTALCVMAGALRRTQEEGRRLILVVTRPHVMRLLTITGLHAAFTITASRRQALRLAGAPVVRAAVACPPLGQTVHRTVA
jgi:anti-sigma B factor antagonist